MSWSRTEERLRIFEASTVQPPALVFRFLVLLSYSKLRKGREKKDKDMVSFQ